MGDPVGWEARRGAAACSVLAAAFARGLQPPGCRLGTGVNEQAAIFERRILPPLGGGWWSAGVLCSRVTPELLKERQAVHTSSSQVHYLGEKRGRS
jgi:hypothetical protein